MAKETEQKRGDVITVLDETNELINVVKPALTPLSEQAVVVPDGWYHLIKLDTEGKEIFGTDVSVSKRTFDVSFAHLTEGGSPKYKIVALPKKKH